MRWSCCGVSTPSATTVLPSVWPSWSTVRTISTFCSPLFMPIMNDRSMFTLSIFTLSMGSDPRCANDE